MTLGTLILSSSLLVPLLIGVVLSIFIWKNRRQAEDRVPFLSLFGIIFGECLYSTTYCLELLLPDPGGFMVLVIIRYFGMFLFMISMFLFVFWYIGLWTDRGKIILYILGIPGVAALIIIATNQYHHLFYPSYEQVTGEIPHFTHTNGIFYVPVQMYGLLILVIIFILILYWMITSPRSYSPVIWLILLAILSPLTGLTLYILGIRPLGFINLTPFSLIFSVIILTIAFSKFHLIGLRPLAYQQIINEIPGGVLLLDGNHRIIEINHSAASILDVIWKDVLYMPLDHVLHPDHPVVKFLSSSRSEYAEFKSGGRFFYLTKKIQTGKMGQGIGTLLLFTDITRQKHDEAELKKKEHSLQKSELRYKQLLENTPDLIWKINKQGTFIYVSPSWTRILGYPVTPTIGKNIRQYIHPDDIPGFELYLNNSIKHVETREGIEYRILHADTTWHWHYGSLIIVSPDSGEEISTIGSSRDITNIKLTENALKRANRQLNLLSSITRHDLLNGIMVIMAYLDLAKEYRVEPELETIFKKLDTVLPIMQSQIEFTRVYDVLGSHEPSWQNISRILERKTTLVSSLEYCDCNMFEIFADPMVERVFDNLIDNSLRHGEHVNNISVRCVESGTNLEIIYQDDGVGIPVDLKSRIFERGFGKNTGMGLFLVREILELTGITIIENGLHGSGARFEMVVPRESYRRVKESDGLRS